MSRWRSILAIAARLRLVMISASAVSTATTSSLLRLPSLPLRFCICLPRSGCGRRPIAAFVALAMAGSSSSAESHRHTNRLASEHSPYLLQHAHNPVDWYPWGEEAFEKARKRNIPIFLSIGYSTCHCKSKNESFANAHSPKMNLVPDDSKWEHGIVMSGLTSKRKEVAASRRIPLTIQEIQDITTTLEGKRKECLTTQKGYRDSKK
ncbi:hypothetical protein ZIOFF_033821 [Zingiber officinale]|uniref:Spermatogenesis-associated protein 20-like TRX domain-containing protein n=1 Tax=Zingiber officinale TaxID=94328 RepID=A0A8J5LCV9_ZINOF|nr:hypothetical protein ZIOFF_033821 [Zingiber officinale]